MLSQQCLGAFSVTSNSKTPKKRDNGIGEAPSTSKFVAAAFSKNVAKKNNQKTTKATRIDEETKKPSPSRPKSPTPPKMRKEDLSFSVTPEFRKRFKKAAKQAGQKKAEFLQILLTSWQDQAPAQAKAKA